MYGAIIDITQELLRILFGSLILAFAVNSKYYYDNGSRHAIKYKRHMYVQKKAK